MKHVSMAAIITDSMRTWRYKKRNLKQQKTHDNDNFYADGEDAWDSGGGGDGDGDDNCYDVDDDDDDDDDGEVSEWVGEWVGEWVSEWVSDDDDTTMIVWVIVIVMVIVIVVLFYGGVRWTVALGAIIKNQAFRDIPLFF